MSEATVDKTRVADSDSMKTIARPCNCLSTIEWPVLHDSEHGAPGDGDFDFFSSAKVFQDVMLETRGNTVDYGTELRHHRALCAWQTSGEVGTNETILIPWG